MPSLTRAEALTRAALLTVDAMEVDLDLDRGAGGVRLAHDDPVHLPHTGVERPSSRCGRASCTR